VSLYCCFVCVCICQLVCLFPVLVVFPHLTEGTCTYPQASFKACLHIIALLWSCAVCTGLGNKLYFFFQDPDLHGRNGLAISVSVFPYII
ncbi:hypothetical protein GBAR_LOCUS24060, partial [Geodia barretti]